MAQVRFVLHDQKKDGRYSILLWYRCQLGGIYKKLIGETIHKRNWSTKTQRALPSSPGAFQLNRYLDEREQQIVNCVREIRLTGARVSKQALITRLSGAAMEFWEYADKFVENPPQEVGPRTLQIYERMLSNLRIAAPGLTFAEIGQGTVDLYIKHRRKQRMNDSTIRNELTKIRSLMNYALKARVINSVPKLELNISGVDPDEIYLTADEIRSLYNLPKSDQFFKHRHANVITKYLMYFVLGTQIGVRVSDLRITPENIFEKEIGGKVYKFANVKTQKVSDAVIIPLSDLAIEILEELKWTVPPFADQKLNDYIKMAGELVGINKPCIWREKIDGTIVETTYPKYALISTHTMRRSFATNAVKNGAPHSIVMKITGHKTERDFLRYIRIDKQEAAEALRAYM